jgi:hypothetical protein
LPSNPFHSSDNEDRLALHQGNSQTQYAANQRSAYVENPARAILMTPFSFVPIRPPLEPLIPSTPAGSILTAWLDAFNSGDWAGVTSYLAKYEPDDKSAVDALMNFRDQTGGFSLIRIEKSEPQHLEALVKEREGSNFARLTLDVSGAASLIVKGIGLRVVPRRPDQPAIEHVAVLVRQ